MACGTGCVLPTCQTASFRSIRYFLVCVDRGGGGDGWDEEWMGMSLVVDGDGFGGLVGWV